MRHRLSYALKTVRNLIEPITFGHWAGLCAFGLVGVMFSVNPYFIVFGLLFIAYFMFNSSSTNTHLNSKITELNKLRLHLPRQVNDPSYFDILAAIDEPVLLISAFDSHDIAARWIEHANPSASTLFGLTKPGAILVNSVRNPEVLEIVDEALFGKIARNITFETGGAQIQSWRAFSAPIPCEDAGKHQALLILRDETDMRRVERMRADFLANASHELRSPLASIIGFIDTLRGHAKDDQKARDQFLNIMAAQADRMGRLVSDLLSLSRIEMNEHVPPSGESDLALNIKDVVEGLSLLAKEKQVSFVVNSFKPGLYILKADHDQLMQVIQNLVDNALKYSGKNTEIKIDVLINQTFDMSQLPQTQGAAKLILLQPDRDGDKYYSCVSICDNGPGIRREFLPRLAERFFRVEGQKSGDRLGTGLGLAIVKHIINRHRGGLVVESLSAPVSDNALGRDIERRDFDGSLEKITKLNAPAPKTFTVFRVYIPQASKFKLVDDGPTLVINNKSIAS